LIFQPMAAEAEQIEALGPACLAPVESMAWQLEGVTSLVAAEAEHSQVGALAT
jgi:hypothetical protein